MLNINDLTVCYYSNQPSALSSQQKNLKAEGCKLTAVDNIRLRIPEGSIFALIGESSCGKTTLGLSITNLIDPKDGKIVAGSVVLDGTNILRLPPNKMRNIRGKEVSYIFQEPASSLNPVFTIGEQIGEALLIHKLATKSNLKKKVLTALGQARLDDPERVFDSYPHELSGGMKQRAMIAMAISTKPKLLVADEPTTALDVDTEKEILDLLKSLRDELGLSVLVITHDISMIKGFADMIAVMYEGKVIEVADTETLFRKPKQEYTKLLITSMPENLRL
ncbi:ABC transporter ATP-binding protein [Candidatus Omnitrophota bacterium]